MNTSYLRVRRTIREAVCRLIVSTFVLVSLSVTVGMAQKQNALIVPSSGYSGFFVLGSPVSRYPTLKRSDCTVPGAPARESCYSTPDLSFFIGADQNGSIAAVRTTSPEMFTDRYIRPRYTHMKDVVSRYGVPERIDRQGSSVFFVYGNLIIEAEGGRTSEEIMTKPVLGITLRRPAATPPQPPNSAMVRQNVQKVRPARARECSTKVTTCALPTALAVGEPCSCSAPSGIVYGFAK